MNKAEIREKIQEILKNGKTKINLEAIRDNLKRFNSATPKTSVGESGETDKASQEETQVLKEEEVALQFLGIDKPETSDKSPEEVALEARVKVKEELSKNTSIMDERVISGLYHLIREDFGSFIEILKDRISASANTIINNKGEALGKEELDKLNTTLKFISIAVEVDRFDTSIACVNKSVNLEKAHDDMVTIRECLQDMAKECSRLGNSDQVGKFKEAITEGNITLTTVQTIIEENGINENSLNEILELAENSTAEEVEKIKDMVDEAIENGQTTGEVGESLDELRELNEHPTFTDTAEDILETAVDIGGAVASASVASVAIETAGVVAGTVGATVGTAVAVAGTIALIEQITPIIEGAINALDNELEMENENILLPIFNNSDGSN